MLITRFKLFLRFCKLKLERGDLIIQLFLNLFISLKFNFLFLNNFRFRSGFSFLNFTFVLGYWDESLGVLVILFSQSLILLALWNFYLVVFVLGGEVPVFQNGCCDPIFFMYNGHPCLFHLRFHQKQLIIFIWNCERMLLSFAYDGSSFLGS